ncbi:MAG: VWA domain-containing protein [Thermoanaerobaculia bacterium]
MKVQPCLKGVPDDPEMPAFGRAREADDSRSSVAAAAICNKMRTQAALSPCWISLALLLLASGIAHAEGRSPEQSTEQRAEQQVSGERSDLTGRTSERVEVEVVNVDVVVVDKGGKRVLDLARDEFSLEVDGKSVPIDYFAGPAGPGEATSPGAPGAPASDAMGSPDRGLLVVFDIGGLEGQAVRLLVQGLEEFISARAEDGVPVLIASFADSLQIHARETNSPRDIERALDTVRELGGRGTLRTLERAHLEDEVRAAGTFRSSLGAGASGTFDHLAGEISVLEDQEITRQTRLISAVEDLVRTESSVPGRRTLVFATPGFSTDPESYLRELLGVAAGQRRGESADPGSSTGSSHFSIHDRLDELIRSIQDARVVAYTVSPSTTTASPNSAEFRSLGDSAAATPRDFSGSENVANLARIADSTGGKNFVITTGLEEQLTSIDADSAATYLLGFSTGPAAGFSEHSIRVRLLRSGLTARGRTFFRRHSPEERQTEALSAAARSGIVERSLSLELAAGQILPLAEGQKIRRVPMHLKIPIGELALTAAGDGSVAQSHLKIRLAVSDAYGGLHLGAMEPVVISIPKGDLERARNSYWSHRAEIEVAEGAANVGALVLDEGSGGWATAACPLKNP